MSEAESVTHPLLMTATRASDTTTLSAFELAPEVEPPQRESAEHSSDAIHALSTSITNTGADAAGGKDFALKQLAAEEALEAQAFLGNNEEPEEDTRESWNSNGTNMARVLITFFAFVLMGMNDAATGAVLLQMEAWYDKSYTTISFCLLGPAIGYMSAAFLNASFHQHLGRQKVGVLSILLFSIGYSFICWAPPFPILVLAYVCVGLGSGTMDAAFNVYIVTLRNENELMGILHACYGVGAIISPLVATYMVAAGYQWSHYYYVLLGYAVVAATAVYIAFEGENAEKYARENPPQIGADGKSESSLSEALKNKYTLIISLFLFCYMGAEVGVGSWTVAFMVRYKGGEESKMGAVASGFWAGLTAGRVVLGFITGRIGENTMVTIYLILAIVFQFVYWLSPTIVGSAIGAAFVGVCYGPLFPTAVLALSRILPSRLHIASVGFASSFGGAGSAVFPFITGAIAESKGTWVLQPIVIALIITMLVLWLYIPTVEASRIRDRVIFFLFRRQANSIMTPVALE
ncbi:major facilitator superfamily domain-containing protein [Myxozyma melibiosi]|uniref:Major facilitator superfamily domain-containing protein n=1 Tax=Myxozyma melibiosi TaxID=54550 RepID=A0ABR1FFA1_9ASCO